MGHLVLVFFEGILSFFSPCVLPILPVYIGILANSNINAIENRKGLNTTLVKNTLSFILGVSIAFFILGSSLSFLGRYISSNKPIIEIIGGIIIILLGIFYMDFLKIPFLNIERKINFQVKGMKIHTAFLLGFTFSFGWTPCIGPMLSSVLILSSNTQSAFLGNSLIALYTLGFVLPFLIITLFYGRLFKYVNKLKEKMGIIKKVGGLIILISGVTLLITGTNSFIAKDKAKESVKTEAKEEIPKGLNKGNVKLDNEINEVEEKIPAPNFSLVDQYGTVHNLKEYRGKVVFLNFWATWCPPCKEELPHIEEVYKEYNKDEVVILGVAAPSLGNEKSIEGISKFLKDNGYTFPVAFDKGGAVMANYEIQAFPTTFIIDKEGNVKTTIMGAMDKSTMEKVINEAR